MENIVQPIEKKNTFSNAKTENDIEFGKKNTIKQDELEEEIQQLFKFESNDEAAIDIFMMKHEYILKINHYKNDFSIVMAFKKSCKQ